MTPAQRSDITNAIWLCTHHAALIDRDVTRYTIQHLHKIKQNHETARADALRLGLRYGSLKEDLVAFGSDVVCTGELVGRDDVGWSIQVTHFVRGEFATLIEYIDQLEQSPLHNRFVLVNALGDGRVLVRKPSVTKNETGYLVQCPVAPSAPRIAAQNLGTIIDVSRETNDLHLDQKGNIARVSGLAALPQTVRSCLSMQLGESPFHADFGVRIAEYFEAFRGSPWREQLLKLEVIRQAAIPYDDAVRKRSYTPLQCVERVRTIEALADAPENNWLSVRVVFDVRGVGRWQHDLSICVPSADALAKIKERQKMFAALGYGSTTSLASK